MSSGRWKKEGCRNSRNRFQRLSFPARNPPRHRHVHRCKLVIEGVFFLPNCTFFKKRKKILEDFFKQKKKLKFFVPKSCFIGKTRMKKKVLDRVLIQIKQNLKVNNSFYAYQKWRALLNKNWLKITSCMFLFRAAWMMMIPGALLKPDQSGSNGGYDGQSYGQ